VCKLTLPSGLPLCTGYSLFRCCWLHSTPLHVYSDLFSGWHVAKEIAKPQVCINSNNSSTDCKNLQLVMEICNRKYKLTSPQEVVVYYSSSTRVLVAALLETKTLVSMTTSTVTKTSRSRNKKTSSESHDSADSY